VNDDEENKDDDNKSDDSSDPENIEDLDMSGEEDDSVWS
jgi:hypothetical protein